MVFQRGGGDLLVKFLKLLNDEQWPWTWSIEDIKGVQSKTVVSRRFYTLNMRKILVVNTWGSKQTSGPPVTGEHNPRAIIGGLRFWRHQCVWFLLANPITALPNHNISYHASLPGVMWTLKATLWWCIGRFKADCFNKGSAGVLAVDSSMYSLYSPSAQLAHQLSPPSCTQYAASLVSFSVSQWEIFLTCLDQA